MVAWSRIKGFIIDMDGVLWHGKQPMPGLVDFFATLRRCQKRFVLATNNASQTQQQYVDKLARFGVTVSPDEILTSSMATTHYLLQQCGQDKRTAYVIGEAGLTEPMRIAGFELTAPIATTELSPVDMVVCGLDRELTWNKLATATLHLHQGAAFYATNGDTTLPTELGNMIGNGGTIAALTAATGRVPMVIGKPGPILYQQALALLGLAKEETIAIGDRLDTDILGAVNTGVESILLLSGISSRADIAEVTYSPTWVMENIQAMTSALKSQQLL